MKNNSIIEYKEGFISKIKKFPVFIKIQGFEKKFLPGSYYRTVC